MPSSSTRRHTRRRPPSRRRRATPGRAGPRCSAPPGAWRAARRRPRAHRRVDRPVEDDARLEAERLTRLGPTPRTRPRSPSRRPRCSSPKIAVRMSLIVRSRSSTASPIRPVARRVRPAPAGTVLCNDIPVANRRWITVSWRSRAIRSRSSTSASSCTCEQPGVLDGDAGRPCQADDELLVDVGEDFRRSLVGEVQVAEHLVAHADRDPEERRHRWMVRRESVAVGVLGEVGQAQRLGVDDEQPEDAVTLGQVADRRRARRRSRR